MGSFEYDLKFKENKISEEVTQVLSKFEIVIDEEDRELLIYEIVQVLEVVHEYIQSPPYVDDISQRIREYKDCISDAKQLHRSIKALSPGLAKQTVFLINEIVEFVDAEIDYLSGEWDPFRETTEGGGRGRKKNPARMYGVENLLFLLSPYLDEKALVSAICDCLDILFSHCAITKEDLKKSIVKTYINAAKGTIQREKRFDSDYLESMKKYKGRIRKRKP